MSTNHLVLPPWIFATVTNSPIRWSRAYAISYALWPCSMTTACAAIMNTPVFFVTKKCARLETNFSASGMERQLCARKTSTMKECRIFQFALATVEVWSMVLASVNRIIVDRFAKPTRRWSKDRWDPGILGKLLLTKWIVQILSKTKAFCTLGSTTISSYSVA